MWNKVEEKLPDKNGEYLVWYVTSSGYGYYECEKFSLNVGTFVVDLFALEEDVPLKEGGGFYRYDSEYGYYEVFPIYWTELPEPPKE